MPKLSIILPGIRASNWSSLYHSIAYPDFELIIVGPYPPPHELENKVIYKYDLGSPMRASCIAASMATGKYITWAADDGIYIGATLRHAMSIMEGADSIKSVVVTKYLEACSEPHPDEYYKLNRAYPWTPYIPDNWWIFNVAVMHKSYYDYLGGWDCTFEACPLGHADLAARAQRDNCFVNLLSDPMLNCSHLPGQAGDHGPVYFAHTEHDAPYYTNIYNSPECLHRIRINVNNWQFAPAKWSRRFG